MCTVPSSFQPLVSYCRLESENCLRQVEKLIDMQLEKVGPSTLATHQAVMHLLALQTNEIHHMLHHGIIDHEEEGL